MPTLQIIEFGLRKLYLCQNHTEINERLRFAISKAYAMNYQVLQRISGQIMTLLITVPVAIAHCFLPGSYSLEIDSSV